MLTIKETFDGYDEIRQAVSDVHITEVLADDIITPHGFIAYAYQADRVVIYDYDGSGDLNVCDGLVRSVLLKAVLRGLETAVFDVAETKRKPLIQLKFITDGNSVLNNINRLMNGCQGCKKD